jgi:hypothetical protein
MPYTPTHPNDKPQVAEPMAHEYLAAESALHRQQHAPPPLQAPPPSRHQHKGGRHARGQPKKPKPKPQPLSPPQKGLGGWRPGGGGAGGQQQVQYKAGRAGGRPKPPTPTPLLTGLAAAGGEGGGGGSGSGMLSPTGLANKAGAVSPASKGSVMHGGDDSLVEEGVAVGGGAAPAEAAPRPDTPIALPGSSAVLPAVVVAAAAPPSAATTTTGAAQGGGGLSGSRTGAAAAAGGGGGGGGGGGPMGGAISSTVTNTSELTNKDFSSLLQQASTPGGLLPSASPATPPPWQQGAGAGAGAGAGRDEDEDEDGFFGRMRQRLSGALFDKLELVVWEHLASRHGQVRDACVRACMCGSCGLRCGVVWCGVVWCGVGARHVAERSGHLIVVWFSLKARYFSFNPSTLPSKTPRPRPKKQAFLASPLFKKYQQFAFLSKKPVSEEDFVLFRVLGRGGFGQVNGACLVPFAFCPLSVCACVSIRRYVVVGGTRGASACAFCLGGLA